MFTREELATELLRQAAADVSPLEVIEFGQYDFESPCSEQCIWAFRGLKRDFPSGMAFWVKTLQAQCWEGRQSYFVPYAEAGRCEQITSTEFAGLVTKYSQSLRQPLPTFLTELTGFQSALRMCAEWNDVAAVAELTEEFVAFYWSTTA